MPATRIGKLVEASLRVPRFAEIERSERDVMRPSGEVWDSMPVRKETP